MTNDQLTFWGFWISVVGLMLTLATLLLAKRISNHISGTRFTKRITSIVKEMRAAQRSGNAERLKTELYVLKDAIETNHNPVTIYAVARLRKLYCAAKREHKAATPNVQLIEGLLLNFKKIHSDAE